jgi:hypothetical protein
MQEKNGLHKQCKNRISFYYEGTGCTLLRKEQSVQECDATKFNKCATAWLKIFQV